MRQRHLVSVIMPVHNRAGLVGRAIDSVLSQTYPNFEVICVDDFSLDDTRQIIGSYIAKFPDQILYLLNSRSKGVSGARNTGIKAARGDFVAFLDSDDAYKPTHLEESLTELQRHSDIDWIFADFERWRSGELIEPSVFSSNARHMKAFDPTGTGPLKRRSTVNLALAHIRHEVLPGLHTSVLRRTLCNGLLFDERLHMFEDWKYRFDAIKKGAKFAYLEKIHHEYYIHGSNLCSTLQHDTQKTLRQCAEFQKMASLVVRQHSLTREERSALRNRVGDFIFWSGYSEFRHGQLDAAKDLMGQGFFRYGFDGRRFKTYLLFRLRTQLHV